MHPARPVQHREPRAGGADPDRGARGQPPRLDAAAVGVAARSGQLHHPLPEGGAERLRRRRAREPARARHPGVGRRSARRAARGVRRGDRGTHVQALRARVPAGLPGRLGGPLGGRGHPPGRGAADEPRADHEPLPPARGAGRHGPLQAVQLRRRGPVRRAADARAHGREGRRRAPVRDPARRWLAGVDLRLRAAGPGRGHRARARRVPGGVPGRVARRPRGRRARRPRAARTDGSRDHDHPGDRQVPAAGGDRVLGRVHGAHPAAPPADRHAARRAVRGPVRPRPARRRAGRADRRPGREGDRRRREPRRGPHPAQLPERRALDVAHELLPPRRVGRCACLHVVQARPVAGADPPAPAPAVRDLRVLAARGGCPPPRRRGRARRPAVVRPP